MQASQNQVCWVQLSDIVEPNEGLWTPDADDGAVLLALRADGRYTLLAGHERLRRLREEGKTCVDAVISPTERTQQRVSTLLGRLVRGDMHYIDEAEEYRSLLGSMNVQELAERIGRSAATVRKKLRLLNLGQEVAALLRQSDLCEGYAHELLRVPGVQGRLRVLKHVLDRGLSLRETEKLIDDVLSHMPIPMAGGRRLKPMMRDHRLYLNAIRGIVEQMRDAGLNASMQVQTGKRVLDVRITVPIFTQRAREE